MEGMSSLEVRDGPPPASSPVSASSVASSLASEHHLVPSQSKTPVPSMALASTASELALVPNNCPNCKLLTRHLRVSREWNNFFRLKLDQTHMLLHVAASYKKQKEQYVDLQMAFDQQSRECGEMREQLTNVLLEVNPLRERLRVAEQLAEEETKRREKVESEKCNLHFLVEQQKHEIRNHNKKFQSSLVETLEKKLSHLRAEMKRMKQNDTRQSHVEWELREALSQAHRLELLALKKAHWGLNLAYKYGTRLSQGQLPGREMHQEWRQLQPLLGQIEKSLHQQYLALCKQVPVRPVKEVWLNDFHGEDWEDGEGGDVDSEGKQLERLIEHDGRERGEKTKYKEQTEKTKVTLEPKNHRSCLKSSYDASRSKEAASLKREPEPVDSPPYSRSHRKIVNHHTEDEDPSSGFQEGVEEAAPCTADAGIGKKTRQRIESTSILDLGSGDSDGDPLPARRTVVEEAAPHTNNTEVRKETQQLIKPTSILDTSIDDSDEEVLLRPQASMNEVTSHSLNVEVESEELPRLTTSLDSSTKDCDPHGSKGEETSPVTSYHLDEELKVILQKMRPHEKLEAMDVSFSEGSSPPVVQDIKQDFLGSLSDSEEEEKEEEEEEGREMHRQDAEDKDEAEAQDRGEVEACGVPRILQTQVSEGFSVASSHKDNSLLDDLDISTDTAEQEGDDEREEQKDIQKRVALPRFQSSQGFSFDAEECHPLPGSPEHSALISEGQVTEGQHTPSHSQALQSPQEEEEEEEEAHGQQSDIPRVQNKVLLKEMRYLFGAVDDTNTFSGRETEDGDQQIENSSLSTSEGGVHAGLCQAGQVSAGIDVKVSQEDMDGVKSITSQEEMSEDEERPEIEEERSATAIQGKIPEAVKEITKGAGKERTVDLQATPTEREEGTIKTMVIELQEERFTETMQERSTEAKESQAIVAVKKRITAAEEETNKQAKQDQTTEFQEKKISRTQRGNVEDSEVKSTEVEEQRSMQAEEGRIRDEEGKSTEVKDGKGAASQLHTSTQVQEERNEDVEEETTTERAEATITATGKERDVSDVKEPAERRMTEAEEDAAVQVEEGRRTRDVEDKGRTTDGEVNSTDEGEGLTIVEQIKTTVNVEERDSLNSDTREDEEGNISVRKRRTKKRSVDTKRDSKQEEAEEAGKWVEGRQWSGRLRIKQRVDYRKMVNNEVESKGGEEQRSTGGEEQRSTGGEEQRSMESEEGRIRGEERKDMQVEEGKSAESQPGRNTEIQGKRIEDVDEEMTTKREATITETHIKAVRERCTETAEKRIVEAEERTAVDTKDQMIDSEEERTAGNGVEEETEQDKEEEERNASERKRRTKNRLIDMCRKRRKEREEEKEDERMRRRQWRKRVEETEERNEERVKDDTQRRKEGNGEAKEKEREQEIGRMEEEEEDKRKKRGRDSDEGKEGRRREMKDGMKGNGERKRREMGMEMGDEVEEEEEKRAGESRKKVEKKKKMKNKEKNQKKGEEAKEMIGKEWVRERGRRVTEGVMKEREDERKKMDDGEMNEEEGKRKIKDGEGKRHKHKRRKEEEDELGTNEEQDSEQEKQMEVREGREGMKQQDNDGKVCRPSKTGAKTSVLGDSDPKEPQGGTAAQRRRADAGKRRDKIIFSWGVKRKQWRRFITKFYKRSKFTRILPDPLGCRRHSVFSVELRTQSGRQDQVYRESAEDGQPGRGAPLHTPGMQMCLSREREEEKQKNVQGRESSVIKEIPARKTEKSLAEQNVHENMRKEDLLCEETLRGGKAASMESRRTLGTRRVRNSSSCCSTTSISSSCSSNSNSSSSSSSSFSDKNETEHAFTRRLNGRVAAPQQPVGLQENAPSGCNTTANHSRCVNPNRTRVTKVDLFGTDSDSDSDSVDDSDLEKEETVKSTRKDKEEQQQQQQQQQQKHQAPGMLYSRSKSFIKNCRSSLPIATEVNGRMKSIGQVQPSSSHSLLSTSEATNCSSEELLDQSQRITSSQGRASTTSDSDVPCRRAVRKCTHLRVESESEEETKFSIYQRKRKRKGRVNGGTRSQESYSSDDSHHRPAQHGKHLTSSHLTPHPSKTDCCRETEMEEESPASPPLSSLASTPVITPQRVKRAPAVQQGKLLSVAGERGCRGEPDQRRKLPLLPPEHQNTAESSIVRGKQRPQATSEAKTSFQSKLKRGKKVRCVQQPQVGKAGILKGDSSGEEAVITPATTQDRKRTILMRSPPRPLKRRKGRTASWDVACRQHEEEDVNDSGDTDGNVHESDRMDGNADTLLQTQKDNDAHLLPHRGGDAGEGNTRVPVENHEQDLTDVATQSESDDDSSDELVIHEDPCSPTISSTQNAPKSTENTTQTQIDTTDRSQECQALRTSRLGPVAFIDCPKVTKKSVTFKPTTVQTSIPAGPDYVEKMFLRLNERIARSPVGSAQNTHATQPQGTSNSQGGGTSSLSHPSLSQPFRGIDYQGEFPVLLPNMYGTLAPALPVDKTKPSPDNSFSRCKPPPEVSNPVPAKSCHVSSSSKHAQPGQTHTTPVQPESHPSPSQHHTLSGTSLHTAVQPHPSHSQPAECTSVSSLQECHTQQVPWLPEIVPEGVVCSGKQVKKTNEPLSIEDLEETLEEVVASCTQSRWWVMGLGKICASINTTTLPCFLKFVLKVILRSDPMEPQTYRGTLAPRLYRLFQVVCVVEQRLAPQHPHSLRSALLRAIQALITKQDPRITPRSLATLTAWYVASASIDKRVKAGQECSRARTFLVDLLFYHPGAVHLALLTAANSFEKLFCKTMQHRGLVQVIVWLAHYGAWIGQAKVRSGLTKWFAEELSLKKPPQSPAVLAKKVIAQLAPMNNKDWQWEAAASVVVLVRWQGRAWARKHLLPPLLSATAQITTDVSMQEESNCGREDPELLNDLKLKISHLFGNLSRALPPGPREDDSEDVVKMIENAVTALLC